MIVGRKVGPFISSKRAKQRRGRTVKVGGTQVIKAKGKKPIYFKKGALHKALGVPMGKPIPEGKKRDALAGKYGEKVRKQANIAFRGALAKGRETAGR
jgi:hypothetical protein